MKAILKTLPPALFILLFTYAAASKMLAADRFRGQLHLQPFSPALADLLVYALPFSELTAVFLLFFTPTRKYGLILATAMMAVFTGYISLIMLHYWGKTPCSCGGILQNMSWTTHLVFNWAFLIAGIAGLLFYRDHPQRN